MSNMVLLGAYVQMTGVFPLEFMGEELEKRDLAKEAMLTRNPDGFRKGVELAKTIA